MKPFALFLTILALPALACGMLTPTPAIDIHAVETIAAGTLTALALTQPPPTRMPPLFTPTFVPTVSSFPTLPSAPIRVQFAPGGTSATVLNTVTFPGRVDYSLRAMKNQQMTVSISSTGNAANFAVTGVADGQPLKRLENEDRLWTGLLPATQDYIISVATLGGSAAFTLTVTIVWP
jgi:hypothetical protein